MELSSKKRPMCFYEQRDYDRIMQAFAGGGSTSTSTEREDNRCREKNSTGDDSSSSRIGGSRPTLHEGEDVTPDGGGYALILNDTTALLYTLFNRAAAALSVHDLTEQTIATGKDYEMKSSKISAIATAFLRIGRELTTHLKLRHTLVPQPDKDNDFPSYPKFMQGLIEQAGDVIDDIENQLREEGEPGYKGPRLFGDNPGPEPAPG